MKFKELLTKLWHGNLKMNKENSSRWKFFSCASLLIVMALVLTMAFSVSLISADTVLYTDSLGNTYTEEDIFVDATAGTYSWDVSKDVPGSLTAYVFKIKNSEGNYIVNGLGENELALVFVGTGEIRNFEYACVDDTTAAYLSQLITNQTKTITDWNTDNCTPWSFITQKGNIKTVVITEGCTFTDWDLLCAYIGDAVNFKFEVEGNIEPVSMSMMFAGAGPLNFKFPDTVDCSEVTDISGMFKNSYSVTLDFTNVQFDSLQKIKSFCQNASQITKIDGFDKFNTSQITDFSYCFNEANNIKMFDLHTWDVSNAVNVNSMFFCEPGSGGSNLHLEYLNLSGWDLSKVTNVSNMFNGWFSAKQMMIPEKMAMPFNLNQSALKYYNYNDVTKTFTQLKYKGEEANRSVNGNNQWWLAGYHSGADVTDMAGNPSDLVINCFKRTDYEYFEIYTDKDGYTYTTKDLVTYTDKTDGSKKARWNISDTGVDNLYANVFSSKENSSKRILVFTGDYKNIFDFEYTYKSLENKITNGEVADSTLINENWKIAHCTPWSQVEKITTAIISSESDPNSYACLFSGTAITEFILEPFSDESSKKTNSLYEAFYCTNLESFEFPSYLDLSDVKDISSCFSNCPFLKTVDLTPIKDNELLKIDNAFFNSGELVNIIGLKDLNVSKVENFFKVFSNCNELSNLTDVEGWDVSSAKKLDYMFCYCTKLTNLNLNSWNVSDVESFSSIFSSCNKLGTLYIDEWDLSSCQTLDHMFTSCAVLKNVNLSKWDVSNVKNFAHMFESCENVDTFNLTNFNPINGENFQGMFYGLDNVTELDLSMWTLQKPKDFTYMFEACPKLETLKLGTWDVSNINSMYRMFCDCQELVNLDFSNWNNTSSAGNVGHMFKNCKSLSEIDLSWLDMTGVQTSLNYSSQPHKEMLVGCDSLEAIKLPIKSVGQVALPSDKTFMYYNITDEIYTPIYLNTNPIEYGPKNLVGKWTPSNAVPAGLEINMVCTDTYINSKTLYTDSDGRSYNSFDIVQYDDIFDGVTKPARWNISESGSDNLWAYVFKDKDNASNYVLVITGDETDILDFEYTYYSKDTKLTVYDKNFDEKVIDIPSSWRNIKLTPWSQITGIKKAIIASDANPNSWDMLFNQTHISEFILEPYEDELIHKSVKSMCGTFAGTDLTEFSIPDYLDTSNCTDISHIFQGAILIDEIDLTNFDSSALTKIDSAFKQNHKLTEIIGIGSLNVSAVTDFSNVFNECKLIDKLDLNDWNVSSGSVFSNMFLSCNFLTEVKIDKWVTTNATDFSSMFESDELLASIDVEDWNVSNVSNLSRMFDGCEKISSLDLKKWRPKNNADVSYLFRNCQNIEDMDLSSWDLSQSKNFAFLFAECKKLESVKLPNTLLNAESDVNMENMFHNSTIKTLDMSKFNIPSGAITSNYFEGNTVLNYIVLPNNINGANITIPELSYFNKTGDVYTPLTIDDRDKGGTRLEFNSTKLIDIPSNDIVRLRSGAIDPVTSDMVYDSTDLKLNILASKDVDAIKNLRILTNGIYIENKEYKTDDEIVFKLTYNTSLKNPAPGGNPQLVIKVTGPSGTSLGTSNEIRADFKEINNNVITFNYIVKESDKANGDIKFKLTNILDANLITTYHGEVIKVDNDEITLEDLVVNKTIPGPTPPDSGGSSRKKKKEEPKVEEPTTKKAIMNGYEDKTFKPHDFVTREEVAAIFARSISEFKEELNFKNFNGFADSTNRWSENYLGFLQSRSLVQGYADGTYRPTENMTRAELAVLISNFDEFKNSEDGKKVTSSSFPDARGRWFEPFVNVTEGLGIFIGYDDGEFKGDRYVSRIEVAIVLNRINNRTVDFIPEEYATKVTSKFTDVKEDDWFFKDVAEATLDLPESWFEEEK